MATATKDDLMSSLMSGGVPQTATEEEDLFGGIPIVPAAMDADSLVTNDSTALGAPPNAVPPVTIPPPVPPVAPTPVSVTSSLLAASGLLGMANGGGPSSIGSTSLFNGETSNGGGGLFDEIDKEAEEKAAAERLAAEQAAQRLAEENAQRAAAAEAQRVAQEEAERLRRQQLQDQMQSIHLGAPPNPTMYGNHNVQHPNYYQPPPPGQMQQSYAPPQQQYPQYPPPPQQASYSAYPPPQQQQQPSQMYPPPNPPVTRIPDMQLYPDAAAASQPRYYQPHQMGSPTAGMHNHVGPSASNMSSSPYAPPMIQPTRPLAVAPGFYTRVLVTEPLLLQSAPVGGFFTIGQAPYWSYQITTECKEQGGVWMVRRRFRHVVALEDRLREDCPGAILPPRPEKHATRAIEEVGANQSAEFAMQRAVELQNYLNLLIHHPIAQQSVILRLFLQLQDDLGNAWPEVSSNAFTRLANASVGAAVKVSESTAAAKLPWQSGIDGNGMSGFDDFGEDNAELIALQNAESIRMGAVLQAVPKLEGAVTLLREQAELSGSVGMEVGRLAKEVEVSDRELGQPLELVSAGMLRAGRRSKRLALELSAAMQSYSNQYKLCRYERMAFADRRAAIVRRQKERGRADHRAAQLLLHQRQQHHLAASQQYYGGNVDRLAQDAAMMDDFATDVNQECEEIGRRLKQEVNRIAWNRKIEWNASVKVIASAMKEAVTERVAIWEGIRENFLTTFPEYATENATQPPNPSDSMIVPPASGMGR